MAKYPRTVAWLWLLREATPADDGFFFFFIPVTYFLLQRILTKRCLREIKYVRRFDHFVRLRFS